MSGGPVAVLVVALHSCPAKKSTAGGRPAPFLPVCRRKVVAGGLGRPLLGCHRAGGEGWLLAREALVVAFRGKPCRRVWLARRPACLFFFCWLLSRLSYLCFTKSFICVISATAVKRHRSRAGEMSGESGNSFYSVFYSALLSNSLGWNVLIF